MKNTLLALTLLFAASPFVFGQKTPETYKFLTDIQTEIETDSVAWKYQTGAVQYTFVGNYQQALLTWDQGMPTRTYTPSSSDSSILKSSTLKNAREYILNRAQSEQIVIINEAHHNPKHRTFTRSLLAGLYQSGYRYLGLEAIADSSINQRIYATQTSGFYTREPEFGNLIHEARRLGFTIFEYEAGPDKNGKEREIEQAQNIQAFMKLHPDGKYLIHCGFDHVYEKDVQNWEKAMAGRLKEYTNIDPFTIDQVKFTEKSKAGSGHYFIYATGEKEPFVLLNQRNEVFNGIREPKQTDVVVVHPITSYKNGRPEWLAAGKIEYWLPKKKLKGYKGPVQILAYRIEEYNDNGVPADIIEIQANVQKQALLLQAGNYMLIVRDTRYTLKDSFVLHLEP